MNCGHPVEYIQLNTQFAGEPVACKYCGLRYALATHDDHDNHDNHDKKHTSEPHE
jgi:hydrogenase maturation factor HypF (carbamoyltransferase family)